MGTALRGDADANAYYYYDSAEATDDVDELASAPADVSDFVGRER